MVSIRVPPPESTDPGATNVVVNKVRSAVQGTFPGVTFGKSDAVSGKVSGELIRNGILAVLVAVFAIAIFGWFRFEWQFGLSTFVAIGHDVLMTLGFFAVTRLEFDLTIVAAVKPRSTWPPKISSEPRARSTVSEVITVRGSVSLNERSTMPRMSICRYLRMFSRIRSSMTILSLIE